ncbi:MAG: 4-hydroxythreonine-4-phosphate dehydrogenase PdxA, partial [Candidatus Omnitrophota bacterium]
KNIFYQENLKLPKAKNIEFLDLKNLPKKIPIAKINSFSGKASVEYLDIAVKLLKDKIIDCLVTAPINKEAVKRAGFRYSGHTEYLKDKFNAKHIAMMFVAKNLRLSLVTRHIPLKEVPRKINTKNIEEATTLLYHALKKSFGIKNPKIAICALNPHASDNGLLGKEENRVIIPAIKKLKLKFKNISGPLPADSAFKEAIKNKIDGLLCMYHDQAMIPIKLYAPKDAVNITLGLDFVRTSPAHGTAFNIAGCNCADPSSMIAAIKLAIQCTKNLKKN